MDVQETRRAVAAIAVVGKIDGHDVIRRESAIDIVQRRERGSITDDDIEATAKRCGARWNGDHWIIEDADLHPMARAFAAQGGPSHADAKWLPIESAPRDGTRIILGKVGMPHVWCDCAWEKMLRKADRWSSFIGPVPFEPTHWMPLPPPPENEHD